MTLADVFGGLAAICVIVAWCWFAVIGFFRHALLGIGTFFFPPIGIIVVTAIEPRSSLIPWAVLGTGMVFMLLKGY